MKKLLPLLAGALVATSANAQVTEPDIYEGMAIVGISPQAKWAASSDEINFRFSIINLQTDEVYEYGDGDAYSGGLGKLVSDNGIVVATDFNTDQPCYWEDGQWHVLPLMDTDFGAYPNAVTPDGSRIVGSVAKRAMSMEDGSVMNVPAVWNRNAEGTYDLYVVPTHPTLDWSGRVPQYILIDDVSADGKVLAGDLVDYSGMLHQPIIFREKFDGTWDYTLLNPELLNPDGIVMPEYPGEAPAAPEPVDFMSPDQREAYLDAVDAYNCRVEPQFMDFMTEDELDDFLAAMEAYYEDWENNPYPYYEDYMTPEELDAYNTASLEFWSTPAPDPFDYLTEAEAEAYSKAYDEYESAWYEWESLYTPFEEVLYTVLGNPEIPSFEMNSARISGNGRYYMMNAGVQVEDPASFFGWRTELIPYVFDLDMGEYYKMDKGINNIMATMVTDDAYVLGAISVDSYSRQAVVAEGLDQPFCPLEDVIGEKDPTLKTWINDFMFFNVIKYEYVYDEETDEWQEIVTSQEMVRMGTPIANSDMSVIATWLYNDWDYNLPYDYVSFVFPVKGGISGVKPANIGQATAKAWLDRNGVLTVSGDVKSVDIYDVNGRMVYSTKANVQSSATGLQRGAYIVKTISVDGKVSVSKAQI